MSIIYRHRYFVYMLFMTGFVIMESCSFNKKIKSGEEAFQYKQFTVASELLLEEYEQSDNKERKAHIAYLLGKTNVQLMRYNDAENWFSVAVDKAYGDAALIGLGNVLKIQEKYTQAIDVFEKLGQSVGRKLEAQREILLCRQAGETKKGKRQAAYEVKPLGVNTFVSEYGATIYDDDYLVFTSENDLSTGRDNYNWTGERFSDLFIMPKDGTMSRPFDATINTRHNEGSPWFSKDMSTMYFNRCFSFDETTNARCKIMTSQRTGDVWSEAKVLPFINDQFQYKHPTLIENDSILVFTADIHEAGSHMDLYYSILDIDGSWSEPEQLSSTINTLGNELFPTGNGDTLYFSSDFLPSLGGLDIYKTYLIDGARWSQPKAMPYPVNSGGDDFSFVVEKSVRGSKPSGYLSSSRNNGVKDDMFRWQANDVKTEPEETEPDQKDNYDVFLVVKTQRNTYSAPDDPNSAITGTVNLPGAFCKIMKEDGKLFLETPSDQNGFLLKQLPDKSNLKLVVSKPGYLNKIINIAVDQVAPKDGEKDATVSVSVVLDRIFENVEVNIPNIYYEYDKWDLKTESFPVLDNLVTILNDNPQINIELSAHTDCRGDNDYNLLLSQRRAKSVVDYLVSKNINNGRLTSTGQGETALLNTCPCETCSEDDHQMNRRTTFKIKAVKR